MKFPSQQPSGSKASTAQDGNTDRVWEGTLSLGDLPCYSKVIPMFSAASVHWGLSRSSCIENEGVPGPKPDPGRKACGPSPANEEMGSGETGHHVRSQCARGRRCPI